MKHELIALKFHNLRKTYGHGENRFEALKGLNLQVQSGDFYGFLGPNGAGKSTAIKCLAGINYITSGDIEVFGHSLKKSPLTVKRMMGIVPQEIYADNFFNLITNLKIQSLMQGIKYQKDWGDYLLQRLQLYEHRKKRGRELSGGMKRRMMIARALISFPRLVVLDEPSADIDVELRLLIWEFIQELNREGLTIILTTHNLQEAEELCHKIAVIKEGELLADESTQKFLSLTTTSELKIEVSGFEDEKKRKSFEKNLKQYLPDFMICSDSQSLRHFGSQMCLKGTLARGDLKNLVHFLNQLEHLQETYQFRVNDLNFQSADLEDIFLKIIQKKFSKSIS